MNQEQAIVKIFNIIKSNTSFIDSAIINQVDAKEKVDALNDYISTAKTAIADINIIIKKFNNIDNSINDNLKDIQRILSNVQEYSNINLTLRWIQDLEEKIKELENVKENFENQLLNMKNAINKIETYKSTWEKQLQNIKTKYSL